MFEVHDELCRSDAITRHDGVGLIPGSRSVLIPGYQVLGEVGRGGMGVVYQARDVRLNRVVAVKVILSGELAGAEERGRFRREAEAAARHDHPNIARVDEVGDAAGRPYCAMEFVGGGPLLARMTGAPWPVRADAKLVADLESWAAGRTLDELKAREPARCRWEWDHLRRRCNAHLVEMVGHTQLVNTVIYRGRPPPD